MSETFKMDLTVTHTDTEESFFDNYTLSTQSTGLGVTSYLVKESATVVVPDSPGTVTIDISHLPAADGNCVILKNPGTTDEITVTFDTTATTNAEMSIPPGFMAVIYVKNTELVFESSDAEVHMPMYIYSVDTPA